MKPVRPPVFEFIRHGMPQGGTRYRGCGVNDPLSPEGWQQMWQSMGDDDDWDIVITSPLLRCCAFAQLFAQNIGRECLIEDDLREVNFGEWEGKTRQQLIALDKVAYHQFFHNSVLHRPAQAEPLEQFDQRVSKVFNRLLESYPQQRVLVVAHAGVMRVAMRHVLEFPLETLYRISIPFAKRLRFELGKNTRLTLV